MPVFLFLLSSSSSFFHDHYLSLFLFPRGSRGDLSFSRKVNNRGVEERKKETSKWENEKYIYILRYESMPGVDKNACSSHRRKRRALVNVGRDRKSRGPAELHASFSAFEQLWRAHACIFHEQTDFNPRGMRSNYPPSPALGLAFVKNQPSSEPEPEPAQPVA